jgi:DNA primase large subunit
MSLIVAEYSTSLELALEVYIYLLDCLTQQTARALPRLDEDDRLVPILNHLSLGFTASEYSASPSTVGAINAAQIDQVISLPEENK